MHNFEGNAVVRHLLAALRERHKTPENIIQADFRFLERVCPNDPDQAAIEMLTGRIRVRPEASA